MAGLSVWELGEIQLVALVLAYLGRMLAIKLIIERLPPLKRSLKQFQIDLALFFAAGMLVCLYNLAVYGFPFVHSGLKVVLGFSTVGFFAAIDLALECERGLARQTPSLFGLTPPSELYPLTRKFTLVSIIMVGLITTIMVLILQMDLAWFSRESSSQMAMAHLKEAVITEILFVMGILLAMVINLVYSYSRNLKLLLHNQTDALEKVSSGQLNTFVPVITNDEFGFIAGHTNSMIDGLKDRLRLLEGVKVAQQVQQNLIPSETPFVDGLDIAAQCVFSDETGGDYLDFFNVPTADGEGLGIVVGDVTGHGVGAALLMASVRGFLRQRTALAGRLDQIVADVNQQMSRDTEGSGRFMSLFFLVVDRTGKGLTWVSAGHDPGILYDRAQNSFEELAGQDLVLGVESEWEFSQSKRGPLEPGQVLVLATDGIWEAHNSHGEMFGKERLRSIIAASAEQNASGILQAILQNLRGFLQQGPMEDDATLVVIKAQG